MREVAGLGGGAADLDLGHLVEPDAWPPSSRSRVTSASVASLSGSCAGTTLISAALPSSEVTGVVDAATPAVSLRPVT